MPKNRLIYTLAIAALTVFFAMYIGSFAFQLLLFALVLPLFSLALTALTVRKMSFSAKTSDYVLRGCEAGMSVAVRYRGVLPCPAMYAVIVCTYPDGREEGFNLELSANDAETVSVCPEHCCAFEFVLTQIHIYDYFGLFRITKKIGQRSHTAVGPLQGQTALNYPSAMQNIGKSIEAYEVREYRPGDPSRMAHWKLSQKTDRLMIKEPLASEDVAAVLAVDIMPPSDGFDALLDELAAVSAWMRSRSIAHRIAWQGRNGVQTVKVASEKDFCKAVRAVLAEECCDAVPFSCCDGFSCPVYHIRSEEGEV